MLNKVFVYGIFMSKDVRIGSFGFDVPHVDHVMKGWVRDVHSCGMFENIVENKDKNVNGLLMFVNDDQLKRMDEIEGIDRGLYRRVNIDGMWAYSE